MGKLKRGGYVFLSWIGDHSPKRVHVYRDDRLVLKWDLEAQVPMSGRADARLRRLIAKLVEEGKL